MDAGSPYHIGKFNYWNYVFGGFPGFVKSVTALSDYSLEIVLTKPYAPFLSVLANPAFGIASPDAIKKYNEEMDKHPVGTGPFCFKSWKKGQSVSLVRNNKYWGGAAKLSEVEFRVIPSSKDRLYQLRQGEIQLADNLDPDDVADAKRDTILHLYLRPCFNVGYLAMNTEKSPFDNRNVRDAISKAIDKNKLIMDVFDNLAKPASTLVPPALWGHNENIKQDDYNPLKAMEILRSAGYPNGFKTTLWVMDSPRAYFSKPVQVANFIRDSLKKIKIEADVKVFSWNEYLERIGNGEHDMALMGWTGDNMDPDNFLYTFLASENAKPGLAGNYAFYKNKDVDRMLEQARQNTNIEFRKNLYKKLQVVVDNDKPTVPLVHTMPAVVSLWTVKGYIPHLTGVESLEKVDMVIKQ
jgi:peptide/nickel transport system substrate-binding protein